MNVDQPSAGSVSTRNEVNAKAAKTTTKNQSRGRAERGRGAMLGANSTAAAKMLLVKRLLGVVHHAIRSHRAPGITRASRPHRLGEHTPDCVRGDVPPTHFGLHLALNLTDVVNQPAMGACLVVISALSRLDEEKNVPGPRGRGFARPISR